MSSLARAAGNSGGSRGGGGGRRRGRGGGGGGSRSSSSSAPSSPPKSSPPPAASATGTKSAAAAAPDAATDQPQPPPQPPPQPQPSLPKLLSALALGVRAANGLPVPRDSSSGGSDDDVGDDDDDDLAFLMAFPEFASKCHEGRAELSVLLSDVLKTVQDSVSSGGDLDDSIDNTDGDYGFESPLLWEKAAEACESLLEDVDAYVQAVRDGSSDVTSGTGASAAAIASNLENAAAKARDRSRSGYALMMDGIVDMEKPQITYNFTNIHNGRGEPFVPAVHPDKPHGIVPLSESLVPQPGHGLETRHGDLASVSGTGASPKIPADVVAADVHYPHPYRQEIQSLQYRPWQLAVESEERLGEHGVGGTLNRNNSSGGSSIPTEKGYWIDTEQELIRLVKRINDPAENVREIAVDLEAHSHRSFGGFTCLMQLSIRRKNRASGGGNSNSNLETASDFLIDTIALRDVMNRHLAPTFADPDIVKVMHGADSDIPWLQRDFGIYVVNLFDTGRAARALPHFSSAGLAYLLGRYAGVEADKKHQLSDWRQRPLPEEMAAYATSDTTYLLDIYDRIKVELQSHPDADVSVQSVLGDSKKVCLIRYETEPFRPSGYKSIVNSKRQKRKRSTPALDAKHERVLRELYDWRDETARELDESLHYVCPNSALLRIATMCPRTVGALQGLVNPCPPLVVRCADVVLRLIKQASSGEGAKAVTSPGRVKPVASSPEKISQLRANASPFAFFRPAEGGGDDAGAAQTEAGNDRDLPPRPSAERQSSGMMSPVVGTKELFKQAGWMTPQGDQLIPGKSGSGPDSMDTDGHTSTEDESDNGKKRRQLLSVDKANENYVSNKYSRHSLEMGPYAKDDVGRRSKTVDGLGAAREALGQGGDGAVSSLQRASTAAATNASRIQNDLVSGNHSILNIARSDQFSSEEAANLPSPAKSSKSQESEDGDEDPASLSIPKSMREIYTISNRNRKGAKAPLPVQKGKPEAVMDVDNLQGAEALLRSSGIGGTGYFEKNSIELKPFDEKTKKRVKVPEGTKELPLSKEEDIGLMTDIGWLKDESEAMTMMAESTKNNSDQQQSGEDTKVVTAKATEGADLDSGFVSKSKKRGGNSQKGKGGGGGAGGSSQEPFDYSKVGSIGASGPKGAPALANPFFSGAAVSGGGALSGGQSSDRTGRPTRRGGRRGKGRGGSGGGDGERIGRKDAGNKTHIYRGGQR